MLAAIVAFVGASTLLVLMPGPDTLVVLRNLLREGRRTAVLTVAGVLTGLVLWVFAAALGLSALLRASHDGYTALRIAGALYLAWLGIQSFRSRSVVPVPGAPEPTRHTLLGRGYGSGLATNLLNPKIGVFFIAFLPGFIPQGQPVFATSLLLGAIFIVEGAAYFVLLILLASRITGWLGNHSIRRRIERLTGVVLICLGIRLAVEP